MRDHAGLDLRTFRVAATLSFEANLALQNLIATYYAEDKQKQLLSFLEAILSSHLEQPSILIVSSL